MSLAYNSVSLKNKIDKISLNKRLKTINTLNQKEVRSQNLAKSKFRAKYGLLSNSVHDDINQVKKAGHIFPYREDPPGGAKEGQEVFNYKVIMDLLFTNGELDTDKILCLHMLAIHPCHNIVQAIRSEKVKLSFSKPDYANAERRHTQSKSRRSRHRTRPRSDNYTLPTYIINFKERVNSLSSNNSEECCADDRRIQSISMETPLIINQNITKLVQTVLEALQKSNAEKMFLLLTKARDPKSIKEILQKAEMQDFMNSLYDRTVLLNSGSFQYLPHLKNTISLNIENPSDSLENLVNGIRSSIVAQNNKCSDHMCGQNEDILNLGRCIGRRGSESSKQRKLSLSSKSYNRKNSFDAVKIAEQLRDKTRLANDHDYKEFKKNVTDNSSKYGTENCPCTSKSRNRFFSKSYDKDMKEYLTRSTHMINKLIDDESHKLLILREEIKQTRRNSAEVEKFKTKMFNAPKFNRRSSYLMRKAKNYSQNFGYKTTEQSPVQWNCLNLANIKYEISVKETEKRVKKFLDEPILPNIA